MMLLLLALSLAAVLLGLVLPAFVVDRLGTDPQAFSILAGIARLALQDRAGLALLIGLFSVLFPVSKIFLMGWIRTRAVATPRIAVLVAALGKWSMLDVFVVATLIGAARLEYLSEFQPATGIYLFAAGILLSMLASAWLASAVGEEPPPYQAPARRQRTVGLLLGLAGLGAFCLALALPLMQVEKWLFWDRQYSIITALPRMWRAGEHFLPAIIIAFVIVLPLLRFLLLMAMRLLGPLAPALLARAALVLQKWSMWDVYALALVIVAVKLGDVAQVTPRAGFWLLLVAIALSALDGFLFRRGFVRDAP